MAYTKAQWDKLQSAVPRDERVSYNDYIATLSGLERIKTLEAASGVPLTAIVDEQTKAAGAVASTTTQKTATTTSGSAAELQAAVAKLSRGEQLSDAEYALIGIKVTPTPAPTTQKFTPTELQTIVAKLTSGQPLSSEEIAAINAPTPTPTTTSGTPTPTPTVTGATPTPTGGTPAPTPTVTSNLIPTPTPTVTVTVGGTPAPTPTTTGGTPTPTPSLTAGTPTPTPSLTAGTPTPTGTTTKAPSGLTYTATDGTVFTDQAAYVQYQKILTDASMAKKATDAASTAERQSAYDLLYAQFSAYGLGSLVEPLRGLIQSGSSPAEFTLKLRESEPYKKRFSANAQRISKGLKAIGEAEYLGLEDQYQNILRNAGLPESYWKRGDLGVQEGFTNFIANDVSAVELEDRVNTAQQRVLYANPEVSIALKTFYPDISNGDLLAYALDPTKGLDQIKRRITAAEIGSSAVQMGLATNVTDAEYLARYGVNKATAQQGYGTIAGGLQRGSQLASIYGENPYTQTTAEQEVFNVPGAAEARKQRQKITGLEKATFSGQTGLSQGALARDRAGGF